MEGKGYPIYKGLQKPLVFRSFKGKFIYYGVGSILLGLVATMIVSSLAGIGYGLLAMAVILGGGLTYTAIMQRKGLHSKKKDRGIYIVSHTYRVSHNYRGYVKKERSKESI